MASKKYTFTVEFDPEDVKRMTRDQIRSAINYQLMEQRDALAEKLNPITRRLTTETVTKKDSRKLGSLGH